jgi:hypothetical protein
MSVAQRVQKHREKLREAGLRPIQIWVPDTRKVGFKEKCREQSLRAAQADAKDKSLDNLLDTSHNDIEGWT